MPRYKIAILEGDGIGPEIMAEAIKVLDAVQRRSDVEFEYLFGAFGADAYFDKGYSFPQETKEICDSADAMLKGPIGLSFEGAKKIPVDMQPERSALLPLRRRYDTYANMRIAKLPAEWAKFSPLKNERIGTGVDIVLVREYVGGLFYGDQHTGVNHDGLRYVKQSFEYDEKQIKRVAMLAFELAMQRKKLIHNVHMSNMLKSSVLWNAIIEEIQREFPEVVVVNILADTAVSELCLNPGQFDVLVMENIFGDIISDVCGGLIGSLGLMPSACLGGSRSCFEPAHGSAPDIAGKGIANPYSMIGSAALMLEWSFGMVEEARNIFAALSAVVGRGMVTPDLIPTHKSRTRVDTSAFGDMVVEELSSSP